MAYELGWGAQPDEWIETDWIDENGVYHTAEELGGTIQTVTAHNDEDDEEYIPF